MITPFLLLPYTHSYTYRRTCTHIPLPKACSYPTGTCLHCLCLSFVTFIVLPSVRSPYAPRIDHLNLYSHEETRKHAVGDTQDCPYMYFRENIPQGCLKTTSDSSLLLVEPKVTQGLGQDPWLPLTFLMYQTLLPLPLVIVDSQSPPTHLRCQFSRHSGGGIFLKKNDRQLCDLKSALGCLTGWSRRGGELFYTINKHIY